MKSQVRNYTKTPDEGWRVPYPKRWDKNTPDEDTYESNVDSLNNF